MIHAKELYTGAVVLRCSIKKVFLKLLQNPLRNTSAAACNFCKEETVAQAIPRGFANFLKANIL